MIDAASATEYATDKIYHVQQVLDLDNKKIYTFVNGEPLTDNINGEEVIAAETCRTISFSETSPSICQ